MPLELPDMSGLQLGVRLKQRQFPHPRLVALSCKDDEVLSEWYLGCGFAHFIVKPYGVPILMHALEAIRLTQGRAGHALGK